MVAPKRRSISLPIILSSVAVALTITLLLVWILVIARNMELLQATFVGNLSLLVGGIVSFVAIITVLVMFTVFLVREISEVRRQTSFIDSVTHELKTPLASLKLAAETLARPELAPDRREQLRVMMLQDVSRLVSLVDGILDASRLVVGHEAGELGEVVIADLIEQVASEVVGRHHIDRDAVVLALDDSLVLFIDTTALRTIVSNLVDNAIKYSDGTPQIRVEAKRSEDGRHVEINVSDRGIGIAKGDLKRIFQRFYRVPEEAVRSRHGTGLGLFVVAALVKWLGGKIEAISAGSGEGTTIRVLLPDRSTSS
ncbi:Signal-transduction histidine kinase senX3 [Enhygromyxa salina]|uniref:histidine kinase n=1 Tax=Enhygromyxa salina TaxID=215803 RepID=A0A2S9XK98_9BACT|nr:HAMP domain-containing sensor histidine kinase [Enhygromyxa salina]PRP93306.1 Signal-transduction histidine kinase senX3 [Enhygromyxa salina]